jgi:hypothetical protein
MNIFTELRRRNKLLYWFGILNIAVAVICIVLQFTDAAQILGVSRWVKPMKFYFSVGLMAWTMNWLLYYLSNKKIARIYSWLIAVTMFFENGLILIQAIRGTTSHFNIRTSFDGLIFSLMGIVILIFSITFIFIAISFFKQKEFKLSATYVWGIRLGIVFFILFSAEGGVMIGLLKHTVGANDGSQGLPVVNWSKQYGDLRIAHFIGIHALQFLPLIGYYVAKSKRQLFLYASLYFIFTAALFFQAMKGIPLFF